jgi:serine protease Do
MVVGGPLGLVLGCSDAINTEKALMKHSTLFLIISRYSVFLAVVCLVASLAAPATSLAADDQQGAADATNPQAPNTQAPDKQAGESGANGSVAVKADASELDSATPMVDVARIFAGEVPSSLDELRAMQDHQRALAPRAQRVTVGVRVDQAQGTGVIISKDGYVLTAAHVAGKPNRDATFFLADGRRVRGKTLGLNRTLDAGLMKINPIVENGQETRWPYVSLGLSAELRPGQWCLATGHPGGYFPDRPPVIRLGRILSNQSSVIVTDCKLVGGDSGGPLFDMDGNVIGIHSRIGTSLTLNMHVPVDVFMEDWERLKDGEEWGNQPGVRPGIGVEGEPGALDAKIGRVVPDGAAAKAGLKAGDVVTRFNDKPVGSFAQLQQLVADVSPGTKVKLEVRRDDETLKLEIVVQNLGGRPRRR